MTPRRSLSLILPVLLLAACSDETPPPVAPTPAPPKPVATTPPPVTPVGIKPVDIGPGFGYPGDRAQLQGWADAWTIDQITSTAWNLWAGMTADSGQSWQGAMLPVWETWCGDEEVFSAAGCKPLNDPGHVFVRPRQLSHVALKAGQTAPPADTQVVSFNKFNPAMAGYLGQQHAGPGGGTFSYTSQQSLVNLNAAWPAGTASADRKVEETPYQPDNGTTPGFAAIETKPVVFVVKATGLTPMPLWQGPAGSNNPTNSVPESWLTCVLLDPANSGGSDTAPVPATPDQIAQAVPNKALSCQTYLYAPLSTIYNFKMNAAEAAAWNAVAPNSGDGEEGNITAAAGDYSVLAAMHVNSKAIVNWTWQPVWWQPGGDTPNNFPGSKQGMTASVTGSWRNYAMCTAWNQTQGNASSAMVVCFNPFLETSSGIPAGQTSNCMSCHGMATVGPAAVSNGVNGLTTANYPAAYTAPINFATDPQFDGFTHTDFSWAIPSDAIDDLPQPTTPATPAPPASQ